MRYIKYIGVVVASLAFVTGVAFPKAVGAQAVPNVTICHRTNSVTNPYVQITVDQSAVDGIGGGNDHFGNHTGPIATSIADAQTLKDAKTKWGDIIPPVLGFHAGLNWTVDGQNILANGCLNGQQIIEAVPADVNFKAPTCDALGSYTVPTTANVEYRVNGSVVAAGTYPAQNGATITVTAHALPGYFIGDEVADSWSFTFTAPVNCGQVLGQVTATPTGPVNAGGGGASNSFSAVIGLVGSIATLALGLILRKRII